MALRGTPTIPAEAADTFAVAASPAIDLAVYHLHPPAGAPADRPPLLFGHCNGFGAGAYLALLQDLAGRFDVYAFDARGHGASSAIDANDPEAVHPHHFAGDLAVLAAALRARLGGGVRFYFVGHSLHGAAAVTLASAFATAPWAAALLYEPPIYPPEDNPLFAAAVDASRGLLNWTEQRRAAWPDAEALAESLRGRGAFARFDDDALLRYCRAALGPADTGDSSDDETKGGLVLRCSPACEAAVYLSHRNDVIWRGLEGFAGRTAHDLPPFYYLAGDDAESSRAWLTAFAPRVAERIPGASFHRVPDAAHMLPLSDWPRFRDLILWLFKPGG
jgi:pimeloyl-ACP methyl ester carboxylesterase